MTNVTAGVAAVFFLAAACAGTKLNDIGDINRNHAGSGGSGDSGNVGIDAGGADETDKGGSTAKGGAGNGGTANVHVDDFPKLKEPMAGAGSRDEPEFSCEACEAVADTPDIRAISATADRIYWIEYGNFDGLGNYQADGRLLSLAFDEQEPTVVATGLQAPSQLAVTASYAYFILERTNAPEGQAQLARLSLSGGGVELLQAIPTDPLPSSKDVHFGTLYAGVDWFGRYFAAGGGYAFWRNEGKIYRLADNAGASPTPFVEIENSQDKLLADNSLLYVVDDAGISSVPFTGTELTPVWASGQRTVQFAPFVLVGNAFFMEDISDDAKPYWASLPKTGGALQRLAEAPSWWVDNVSTNGTTYVADFAVKAEPFVLSALREGNISDPSTARTLATAPAWRDESDTQQSRWRAWAATPTAVYLGYDGQLYRVARQF